jgi:AcrR family transcriptional regulator
MASRIAHVKHVKTDFEAVPAKPAVKRRARGDSVGPRNKVYEIAAEVFHHKGYDNTSMSDIASAVGLTKAGLYHHVASKERLLYTILDYGMDMTEAYVVAPLASVKDPIARLRKMIELHLKLILEGRRLAVTGLLHECQGLSPNGQDRINRRKKKYVRLVSEIIGDVLKSRDVQTRSGTTTASPVNPKVAALALLGMLNWTYQWYKPSGAVKPDQVVREFQDLFINGVLGGPGVSTGGPRTVAEGQS